MFFSFCPVEKSQMGLPQNLTSKSELLIHPSEGISVAIYFNGRFPKCSFLGKNTKKMICLKKSCLIWEQLTTKRAELNKWGNVFGEFEAFVADKLNSMSKEVNSVHTTTKGQNACRQLRFVCRTAVISKPLFFIFSFRLLEAGLC